MQSDQWYYIKNWWKYQHYRDRHPPWIKLHRTFFIDPAVQSLTEREQLILVRLWMAASDNDGRFPDDRGSVGRSSKIILGMRRQHRDDILRSMLAKFESKGLISNQDIRGTPRVIASKPLDQRKRQRKSTEIKKNSPIPPKGGQENFPPFIPDWIPRDAWLGFVEMRTRIRKPLTDRAIQLAIRKLETLKAAGNDPGEVLDQSTMGGWQGLIEVKHGTGYNDQRRKRTIEGLTGFLKNSSEMAGDIQRDV